MEYSPITRTTVGNFWMINGSKQVRNESLFERVNATILNVTEPDSMEKHKYNKTLGFSRIIVHYIKKMVDSDTTPSSEGATICALLKEMEDYPTAGTKWNVLSMDWWEKWKTWTSEDQDPPGPISAESILLSESEYVADIESSYTNNVLKSGIS
jgi:hypothetical protein